MKTCCKVLILIILAGYSSGALAAQRSNVKAWRVGRIYIIGNSMVKKIEILNLMDLRPVLLKKRPRFSNGRLKSDITTISRYYRDIGFLSVAVSGTIANRDSLRKIVNINVTITEGRRTTITGVDFLPKHPDAAVAGKLRCKTGNPLVSSHITDDERFIQVTRAKKGFLNARTSAQTHIDTASAQATILFTTTDGPRVVVDTIHIKGAEHLKKRVVSRELKFRPHDTLTLDAVQISEKRLYQSGLFSSAYIEPVFDSLSTSSDTSGVAPVPVLIALREADFFRLKLGLGYGTGEGLRGSIETSYYNLFRVGHRLSFKGNLSQKVQQAQSVYTTPWLFGIPLRFDASLNYNRFSDVSTFLGEFWGPVLSLERSFGEYITCQLWTKFEDVLWIKSTELPGEYPKKNTQSFGVDLTFDSRNNLLDPSSGFYSLLKCEAAGIAGINSNQFLKLTSDNRVYWKFHKLTLASGIKFGWVRPYGSSPVVPLQEQFFAGGSQSVRGFKDKFLLTFTDTTDTIHPKSGTVMITTNLLEVRFPLIWWIQGAVFADAGILGDTFNGLSSTLREIRWTAGPGLRVNTPLAIIRFDFGFKLNRRSDEPLTQWHLDVGQSF